VAERAGLDGRHRSTLSLATPLSSAQLLHAYVWWAWTGKIGNKFINTPTKECRNCRHALNIMCPIFISTSDNTSRHARTSPKRKNIRDMSFENICYETKWICFSWFHKCSHVSAVGSRNKNCTNCFQKAARWRQMQRCFAFDVWCVDEGVAIGQKCTGSRDVPDVRGHMKSCVMMLVSNI